MTEKGRDEKTGRWTSAYKPEFCEKVIELGKQGKSKVQVAAELGTHRDNFPIWCEKHPEFKEAWEYSRQLAQAKWEDLGEQGLAVKGFQGNMYLSIMRIRFPGEYTEQEKLHKVQLSGDKNNPVVIENLDNDLNAVMEALRTGKADK